MVSMNEAELISKLDLASITTYFLGIYETRPFVHTKILEVKFSGME